MTIFLGLLDLKKEAVVGLDGQTIMLKTDDFLGIRDVSVSSATTTNLPCCHLATVRSQLNATVTVGFFFTETLVRRYDPQTEEIASDSVDALTVQNLLEHVASASSSASSSQDMISPSSSPRILPYSKVVSAQQQTQWAELQTCYISSSQILKRRKIPMGTKIIPGSFSDEMSDICPTIQSANHNNNDNDNDGTSIRYPSIPVVDNDNLNLRKVRHAGCKKYLASLTPSERTQLFVTTTDVSSRLLQDILVKYYDSDWRELLGDLQLAYTLVLNLQCFASLEHWRDLIAMLSLVSPTGIQANVELYRNLIRILPAQIVTVDKSFLEDIDQAGNNFLIPSLRSLARKLSQSTSIARNDPVNFQRFSRLLANQFPQSNFLGDTSNNNNNNAVYDDIIIDMDEDMVAAIDGNDDSAPQQERRGIRYYNDSDSDDDDDDDGPVIVAAEDIQASLERSSGARDKNPRRDIPFEVQSRYPVLLAAIQDHEDILMTCARALDEKKDVSLVREAAAYLEDTERKKFYEG